MYVVSLSLYNLERADERKKAKERRAMDSTPSTWSGFGNKWKSSYVQVLRSKTSDHESPTYNSPLFGEAFLDDFRLQLSAFQGLER